MIGAIGNGIGAYTNAYAGGFTPTASGYAGSAKAAEDAPKVIMNPGESTKANPGKRVSPAECGIGRAHV